MVASVADVNSLSAECVRVKNRQATHATPIRAKMVGGANPTAATSRNSFPTLPQSLLKRWEIGLPNDLVVGHDPE